MIYIDRTSISTVKPIKRNRVDLLTFVRVTKSNSEEA